MIKNRDHWTVTDIQRDGAITATGRTGTVTLPATYVRQHVELAYAETSHASQGRTVDRSFLFLDGPTNMAGIYVPMTRGRLTNEAFVVVYGEQTAADVITESLTRTWIDRPAIERRAELERQQARAREPAAPRDRSSHPTSCVSSSSEHMRSTRRSTVSVGRRTQRGAN